MTRNLTAATLLSTNRARGPMVEVAWTLAVVAAVAEAAAAAVGMVVAAALEAAVAQR